MRESIQIHRECPNCKGGIIFLEEGDTDVCLSGECDKCNKEFYVIMEGDGYSCPKEV